MFETLLNDTHAAFTLPVALMFGAGTGVVLLTRWLLLRFAPAWLVGPHGILIDPKTRMEIVQIGHGHIDPSKVKHPASNDDGPSGRCA